MQGSPHVSVGQGGLPTVQLAAPDGSATAEVYCHGATLTSWRVDGVERLFVSPAAVFEPPKAIRGGVPVCFPQFGLLGPLPQQHGFARQLPWEVAGGDAASCTLVLASSEATRQQWPHEFRAEMTISLSAGGALRQALSIENTGDAPFEFTAALHTYFTVSDVANASVLGLQGLLYHDNAANSRCQDAAAAVTFGGEVDRAYIGAPELLKLADGGTPSAVCICKSGFQDAVVWNPAEAKAASMGDLGAGHYRGFVCVEVAQARSGPVSLRARGDTWEGSQTLRVEYAPKEREGSGQALPLTST